MAELIRRAIDEWILHRGEADASYRRAIAVVGKGRSGLGDVSRRHDEDFVETLLDQ